MEDQGHKAKVDANLEGGISRRRFLINAGITGVGTVSQLVPDSLAQQPADQHRGFKAKSPHLVQVTLRVNGLTRHLSVDPRATLLDTLREAAHLTGTKKGCDHGQCGACTVHVNGRRINSCMTLGIMHEGDEVTTIEGLGTADALHPLQTAFLEHDAFQCGYCTSGQIMSAAALLHEPCGAADSDVKELMSGNICRCGAYQNIVSAIQATRRIL